MYNNTIEIESITTDETMTMLNAFEKELISITKKARTNPDWWGNPTPKNNKLLNDMVKARSRYSEIKNTIDRLYPDPDNPHPLPQLAQIIEHIRIINNFFVSYLIHQLRQVADKYNESKVDESSLHETMIDWLNYIEANCNDQETQQVGDALCQTFIDCADHCTKKDKFDILFADNHVTLKQQYQNTKFSKIVKSIVDKRPSILHEAEVIRLQSIKDAKAISLEREKNRVVNDSWGLIDRMGDMYNKKIVELHFSFKSGTFIEEAHKYIQLSHTTMTESLDKLVTIGTTSDKKTIANRFHEHNSCRYITIEHRKHITSDMPARKQFTMKKSAFGGGNYSKTVRVTKKVHKFDILFNMNERWKLKNKYKKVEYYSILYKAVIGQLNSQDTFFDKRDHILRYIEVTLRNTFNNRRNKIANDIEVILEENDPSARAEKLMTLHKKVRKQFSGKYLEKTRTALTNLLANLVVDTINKSPKSVVFKLINMIYNITKVDEQYFNISQQVLAKLWVYCKKDSNQLDSNNIRQAILSQENKPDTPNLVIIPPRCNTWVSFFPSSSDSNNQSDVQQVHHDVQDDFQLNNG